MVKGGGFSLRGGGLMVKGGGFSLRGGGLMVRGGDQFCLLFCTIKLGMLRLVFILVVFILVVFIPMVLNIGRGCLDGTSSGEPKREPRLAVAVGCAGL
jgi:hypothetical protein